MNSLVIDHDALPVQCNDETHVYGCPGAAGGDHVVAKSFCRCRALRSETQEYLKGKCPTCRTFARDHEWSGDAESDFRCIDCDVRYGSHGGPAYGSAFASVPAIPVAKTLTLETAGYIANGEVTIVYERDDYDPALHREASPKCRKPLEEGYYKGTFATCGDCFGGTPE